MRRGKVNVQLAELGLELETNPGVSSLHKPIITENRRINSQDFCCNSRKTVARLGENQVFGAGLRRGYCGRKNRACHPRRVLLHSVKS